MSHDNEFQELEGRLRRQRPEVEPMPPAFKAQLRDRLLDQAAPKRSLWSPIGAAVGLALLILVPLVFWAWQSSLSRSGPLAAVSVTRPVEATAVPMFSTPPADPTRIPNGLAAAPDRIAILATYPQSGQPVNGQQPTVWVLLSYEFPSIPSAELSVRLTQAVGEGGGRGVALATAVITQTRGTLLLPLTLDADASAQPLGLSIMLRDPASADDLLMLLDFPQGYQWPIAPAGPEPAPSEALFLGTSLPESFEGVRAGPAADEVAVTAYVAYTLSGYEQGMLTLGYQLETPSLGSAGGASLAITRTQDVVEIPLVLDRQYFNEDGTLNEAAAFSVELAGYKEATGEYLPVFPEGAVQALTQVTEKLSIQSVTLGQDDAGRPTLDVLVWYERRTDEEGTLVVTIEDGSPEPLASVPLKVFRRQDQVTAALPIDLSAYPGDYLFRISATLDAAVVPLTDDLAFQAGALMTPRENEVWIIAAETITSTSPAVPTTYQANLVIGYALSDEYESGMVEHALDYQYPGGGGGGGGGGQPVEPGTGTLLINIPFELRPGPSSMPFSLTDERSWPPGLSLRITLTGRLSDGTEVILHTLELPSAAE